MQQLHIRMLGELAITLDDQQIILSNKKCAALLIYLLVTGEMHSREKLAGLLWGDLQESKARSNLRKVLFQIPAPLKAYVINHRQTLSWNFALPLWFDLTEFQTAVTHIQTTSLNKDALTHLPPTLDLYNGQFLSGFFVRKATPFHEWLEVEQERVIREATAVFATIANEAIKHQMYLLGQRFLHRVLTLQPWHEPTHRQLIHLHLINNDRTSALLQYHSCVKALRAELDVSPDAETVALYEEVRRGRPYRSLHPRPQQTPHPHKETPSKREVQRLALLNEMWQIAPQNGRLLFVKGEAGSGKTVLLSQYVTKLKEEGQLVLFGRCNAFSGAGDAYLPIREMVSQLFGTAVSSRFAQPRQSLVELCISHGPQLLSSFINPADMLHWLPHLNDPEEQQRLQARIHQVLTHNLGYALKQSHLFEQLSAVWEAVSNIQPLLLVMDDLQWADDGSLDLLFYLTRTKTRSITLVGAYRSEEVAIGRADGQPHPLQQMLFELKRRNGHVEIDLDRVEKRPYLDAFVDLEPNHFDETFRQTLLHHTDGHPLFMAELLRTMQDRGEFVKDEQGMWVANPQVNWHYLPKRIEGVIGERIERLTAVQKQILSIAAVEGDYFSAEVVAHMMDMPLTLIIQELGHLLKTHRLIVEQGVRMLGDGRVSTYRYRHAIIQQYVYGTLNPLERIHLHETIANTYEALYDSLDGFALTLSRHYHIAQDIPKALDYLITTILQTYHRYALTKAVQLIEEGLELIMQVNDQKQRNFYELNLLMLLGPILVMTNGFSGKRVGEVYTRARVLNESFQETPNAVAIQYGLWLFYVVSGEAAYSLQIAPALLEMAREQGDIIDNIAARYANVGTFLFTGRLKDAVAHGEEGLLDYDVAYHKEMFERFGDDPGMNIPFYTASALALLGSFDRAIEIAESFLEKVRQLGNPFSLALSLSNCALLFSILEVSEKALPFADQSLSICQKHGFVHPLALASVAKGWSQINENKAHEGMEQIQTAITLWQNKIGGNLSLSHFYWLLAEGSLRIGKIQQGLEATEKGFSFTERCGQFWEADLYRTKALLIHAAEGASIEVTRLLQKALNVSREQEALYFELKTAVSLFNIAATPQEQADAMELIKQIRRRCTETFQHPIAIKADRIIA